MKLLDDLRDHYNGHIRVEPGPHTPRERRKLRIGSAAFIAGLTAWMLTQSMGWMLIAMVATADVMTQREDSKESGG